MGGLLKRGLRRQARTSEGFSPLGKQTYIIPAHLQGLAEASPGCRDLAGSPSLLLQTKRSRAALPSWPDAGGALETPAPPGWAPLPHRADAFSSVQTLGPPGWAPLRHRDDAFSSVETPGWALPQHCCFLQTYRGQVGSVVTPTVTLGVAKSEVMGMDHIYGYAR